MSSTFIDSFMSLGFTNLIDVDGMTYVPVADLLMISFRLAAFLAVVTLLLLVAFGAFGSAISCYIGFRKIADS